MTFTASSPPACRSSMGIPSRWFSIRYVSERLLHFYLHHLRFVFAHLSVRRRFSPLRQIATSWLSSFWLLVPFWPLSPSPCHGYRSIVLPVLCLPVEVRWTCSSPLQQTPTRCSLRHISVSVWLVWFALAWSWHLLSASCGPSLGQLLVVLSLVLYYFSISFCIIM